MHTVPPVLRFCVLVLRGCGRCNGLPGNVRREARSGSAFGKWVLPPLSRRQTGCPIVSVEKKRPSPVPLSGAPRLLERGRQESAECGANGRGSVGKQSVGQMAAEVFDRRRKRTEGDGKRPQEYLRPVTVAPKNRFCAMGRKGARGKTGKGLLRPKRRGNFQKTVSCLRRAGRLPPFPPGDCRFSAR